MKMVESSPKRLENSVGKGEIAHDEQFLLFPQCFQKTCTVDMLKPGLVWERIKPLQSISLCNPLQSFGIPRVIGAIISL